MHKVFLSSTARDLTAYRDAVTAAVNRLDGFHCVRMEDFGARDSLADDFCRARIAECEVAVFIIGLCYGSSPKGIAESYTVQEYQAAKDAKISRLIFLSADGSFYQGYYREPDEQWTKQQGFRALLNQERIRDTFTTPEELAAKAATALSNWVREHGGEPPATSVSGVAYGGNVQVVYAEKGATVVIGDAPVPMTAVERDTALGRYLQHVISRNRYLQLQGIRSGGRLVHIELDRIYIRLRATQQRLVTAEGTLAGTGTNAGSW